ncbi:hypothetical protein B0J17DRAFT_764356 [Rhizoctonia solani]|nr:hypothetical protein B0J17DRAFT_764356 [Rhizoctonia solani]
MSHDPPTRPSTRNLNFLPRLQGSAYALRGLLCGGSLGEAELRKEIELAAFVHCLLLCLVNVNTKTHEVRASLYAFQTL